MDRGQLGSVHGVSEQPGPGAIRLAAAADELGVHYQTAYKWVRDGSLPAVRIGREYRIASADLASFVEQRGQPKAPPRRQPDTDRAADRMLRLLLEGDESTARSMARDLVAQGTPATRIAAEVLTPAMHGIGMGWEQDRVSVPVEHRATAIAERILGDVMPNPRGRRRGTAVVAAPSGERHGLAALMATVALRDDNWRVEHLGADVPVDEIERFCDEVEADLIVLTVISEAADTGGLVRRLERDDRRVLVGAPGATLANLVSEAAHKSH